MLIRRPTGAPASIFAICMLIAASFTAVYAQKKDMPLTATKQAKAIFIEARTKGENLEDTGTLYDQAVKMDPNFAYGFLFAGQTNLDFQKNLAKAVELSDKASPAEREVILSARDGNYGNTAGQRTHLEAALKLFPNDKRIHMLLAAYFRNLGDNTTSLHHLNEATKIDKNYAPAYNLIGYTNMAQGKMADAETAFKSYIRLIPNNPNPYDSYAEFLMNTGKFDDSITQYKMALAKDPTFVNSYRGMGNDYAYKGDFSKARESYDAMYQKSTNDGNRDQALYSTMNSWIEEGNMKKAMEVNDGRIAKAVKEVDPLTELGLHNQASFMCLEAGDLDCAETHAKMSATLAADKSLRADLIPVRMFASQQQMIRIMASRGDFDGARTMLDSVSKYAAESSNPNVKRNYDITTGYVELKQKNYAKANESFTKADSQDPWVWYLKAQALEGQGDNQAAMTVYRKIAAWNQLDLTNYSLIKARAAAKLTN